MKAWIYQIDYNINLLPGILYKFLMMLYSIIKTPHL